MASAGTTGRPKAEPEGKKGGKAGPKEAEARARRAESKAAPAPRAGADEVHPALAAAAVAKAARLAGPPGPAPPAATPQAPDPRTADEILAGRSYGELKGEEANAWLDATERERKARPKPGDSPFKAAMAQAQAKALKDQEAALAARAGKGKAPKAPPPEEEELGPPVLPTAVAIRAAAATFRAAADALELAIAQVKVMWDAPWPGAHPDTQGNVVAQMECLIAEDRIGAKWTVTDLRELAEDLDDGEAQAPWARAILHPAEAVKTAAPAPKKAAAPAKTGGKSAAAPPRVREPGDDDEPIDDEGVDAPGRGALSESPRVSPYMAPLVPMPDR